MRIYPKPESEGKELIDVIYALRLEKVLNGSKR